MAWLKNQGRKPIDVSKHRLGWDIECDREKFEVKGRKSFNTAIRLTENEWQAAKKHGVRYTLLIFTARTKAKLNEARPQQIPDPARTRTWEPKITYEYFLNE